MKITATILLIIFSQPIFSNTQNFEQKFKQANKLYSENKFEEALNLFNEIIDAKYESPELYFNIANTYYRINNVGKSVYFFEKALLLNHNDEDIKYNLELANLRVKNKPAIMPKNTIINFFQNIIFYFTADFWAYFSIFLLLIFMTSFYLFIKTNLSKNKKIFFLTSMVILSFLISSIIFMQYQMSVLNSHRTAIVLKNEADAKSSPSEKANVLFKVYEGYKVEIENTNANWSEIKLTDGKKAWIKNDVFKNI